jgi:hypothetical protein
LSPTRTGGNERKAAGIQHDLHAHQCEDQITPREKSCQPQQKQHCRE